MPSFRSGRSQAEHAVAGLTAIGQARHGSNDNRVHSLGTARAYRQALASLACWLRDERQGSLRDVDRDTVMRYLDGRAADVRQPTLDQDRQACQALLGVRLPRIKSELESVVTSRSYTSEQLAMIRAAQSPRHAIATELAECCGLRAHEMLTLRRIDEQEPSSHRSWDPRMHSFRQGVQFVITGKGGLRRTCLVEHSLALRVEALRLDTPQTFVDRGICYESYYAYNGKPIGGQSWSASFSAASQRALGGWSHGGHGCRHTYTQTRVSELQGRGYSFEDACAVVSQELGHFRASIVKEVYLR